MAIFRCRTGRRTRGKHIDRIGVSCRNDTSEEISFGEEFACFYSAEKCNAGPAYSFLSRASARVSGSASASLPSSSEYDPVVSAEKRRIAARLFQIILLAHSPALLRETSFLHRRAEVFCGERCNFFRCFEVFEK